MTESLNLDGIPEDELARFLAFREKVDSANISDQTLLATDYLNHFNEIVMMLEMVPDMPEIMEDVKAWRPKSYCEHFRDSGFSDRELAIEAYDHVPTKFRKPFEDTVTQMDSMVTHAITRLETVMKTGDPELLHATATAASRSLQRLMDVASAIIHGSETALHQDEIDDLAGF